MCTGDASEPTGPDLLRCCPAGTFNPLYGMASCEPCGKGYYNPFPAQMHATACIQCAAHSTTRREGAITEDECECIEGFERTKMIRAATAPPSVPPCRMSINSSRALPPPLVPPLLSPSPSSASVRGASGGAAKASGEVDVAGGRGSGNFLDMQAPFAGVQARAASGCRSYKVYRLPSPRLMRCMR